ncbi:MAG: hydantoinase B/oxoprolinase family protein [Lentilitoribacter sp.]
MDDPFTCQIINAAIDASAQEMFDVLRRTAMSPIIYEVLDVGTGITDPEGNLISSGAGIPSFIGVLDKSVSAILAKFEGNVFDGDVFITNDPNYGGVTHLNDIVIAQPVFHDGQLIAWVASIAHWGDIGGKTPGSMPVDVIDIFGEGLRLPLIKLMEKGAANKSVMEIITTNSRLSDFVVGDMNAQLAASQKASILIKAVADRYGIKTFFHAISSALDEGFERASTGLYQLPKGAFSISEPQDDGENLNAVISITDEKFIVDLSDNPNQMNAPHNTSRDGAIIACQMFFKALTDPERFANAGSFKPLEVLTKPGTIFHAVGDVPHGYYFETRIRLFDMLWHCMAKHVPDRLPAGHFASIFGTVIAGQHPDTGKKYTMVEPQMGGWGATSERDGMSAMYSTSHGDTFNCPVEIAEARYGLEVIEKSLAEKESSDGIFQGGCGVKTVYQLHGQANISVGISHAKIPVWSLNDAPVGGVNSLEIEHPNHVRDRYSFVSGLVLDKGSKIIIKTANGGNC